MAVNNIADSVRNDMCDAFVDAIDAGGGAGFIRIFTSSFSTLLATLTFSATAFGNATGGTATANSISPDTSADASGTAEVFQVVTSDTSTVVFEGTVGTSGEDINFNTDVWTAGDNISITSMTVTMPAS